MTTKEKILFEALRQFSIRGFSSVSVRDIAYAIGIKESSLYNHYRNKQDIFDQIILFCQKRVSEQYSALNLQDTLQGNFTVYDRIAPETLHSISKTLFSFYASDEYMRMFRQMLTIEQFNNPEIETMYKDLFIDQPIGFQSTLFSFLMETGAIIKADPEALAWDFYAPIFMLLSRYNKLNEEAERLLTLHIDHFILKNGQPK